MTAPVVNPLPYDNSNPEDILRYSQFLIWKTFWEVLEKDPNLTTNQKDIIRKEYWNKTMNKAWYGDFIQENFFYVDRNSDSNADLNDAWVELKVSPFKKVTVKKQQTVSAKERMVLTKINYMSDVDKSFEESHFLEKCKLMLFVYYFYDKNKANKDYMINYVDLFEFPDEDLEIIKKDYEKIINKIKQWKAHELSEWDTIYLWACTKAEDWSKLTKQPNSDILAKPRAFSLKSWYMTMILRKYLSKWIHTYKPLIDTKLNLLQKDVEFWTAITNVEELKNESFENYIISKMEKYYWYNVSDLFKDFNLSSNAKSKLYLLANRMLGVKEENIEEFYKANIKIKTIRLKTNWMPKESMSFPYFKYKEIIKTDFYNSDYYKLFSETKFLFLIFQMKDNDDKSLENLTFTKAMFRNAPYEDLEWPMKYVWEDTVKKINEGDYENFVAIKDDKVSHVRPKATKDSWYFETPQWWLYRKQCFWLNAKYIKEQIEKGGN